MTPDPTLTDEELAEMERGHESMKAPFRTPDFCRRCSHYWPCPTSRLIAALRASREEVATLQGAVAGLKAELAYYRDKNA